MSEAMGDDREDSAAPGNPMRLLGLYAHPDDETVCSGGTFARYAQRGAEIRVISATRGQAGQIRDARVATRRTLGQVREGELRRACQQLGVQSCRCLEYMDGALASTDRAALVGELTREIRAFQPTAVFTFGPNGGYGHPDHVTISAAVTEAFDRAGEPAHAPQYVASGLAPHTPASLYYAHFPAHRRRLLDRMVQWLVSHDERFRGDIDFVVALLHLAEEAHDLRVIADHLETRWFPAGAFVIEQGEAATALFMILSGTAEAVRESAGGTTEVLGRLEPGAFFGELGIAHRQPRNAHVIAQTHLTCLQFSPAEPTPFAGRGEGAHLPGAIAEPDLDEEAWGEATTRIDVGAVIERKMAAFAAYRSQFAFEPGLIPMALLRDLFGVEYFIRARPARSLETEIREQ